MMMQHQWKIRNGDRFFARSESQADTTPKIAPPTYIGTYDVLAPESEEMCLEDIPYHQKLRLGRRISQIPNN
jgi:hypothetical protein